MPTPSTTPEEFVVHRVNRGEGSVYVREYAGTGPAFVLMHGFPDNMRIYDLLIPHLVAAGRRVVLFDFLGFGRSDKPDGAQYSFAQHAGVTYPLFGPVEMNHEEMAAELSRALGRKIVFENVPITDYCNRLAKAGIPAYIVQHFGAAMLEYQQGVMSGMNDNVSRLTGQAPMSVGDFARAHLLEPNGSRGETQ